MPGRFELGMNFCKDLTVRTLRRCFYNRLHGHPYLPRRKRHGLIEYEGAPVAKFASEHVDLFHAHKLLQTGP